MTLTIWTNLFLFVCAYQFIYLGSLAFRPAQRTEAQVKNKELELLRKIAVKSLDEQKRFLELKFSNTGPRWTWNGFLESVAMIGMTVLLLLIFRRPFITAGQNVPAWLTVLCIFIVPFGINLILRTIGMNRPSVFDVIYMLKPKRRKI